MVSAADLDLSQVEGHQFRAFDYAYWTESRWCLLHGVNRDTANFARQLPIARTLDGA
jgi:hypothetical protein